MRLTPAAYCMLILLAHSLLISLAWANHRIAPESAPVARGAQYAQVRGCVDCHGDVRNPSADANSTACSNVNTMIWHPDYAVRCSDVMAYFETVRLRRNLEERMRDNEGNSLVAGEALARKYYCFQCHGHLGQGGFENDGSFKGYVPGYFGNDFRVLTQNADPQSVRAWIVNGMDPAMLRPIFSGRIAEFFVDRQAVSMPSFRSLPDHEIDILVNYVITLNSIGPMTAATVRSYAQLSRSGK